MTRFACGLPSLALFLCLVTPVRAQAPGGREGCWRLSFSAWQPSPGSDSTLYLPLPDTLWLNPQRANPEYLQGARRPNMPAPTTPLKDSLRALWRPLPKDSIEVWFPVWWSTGIRAHVRVQGDSLHGRAWIYVDYRPEAVPYSSIQGARCGSI